MKQAYRSEILSTLVLNQTLSLSFIFSLSHPWFCFFLFLFLIRNNLDCLHLFCGRRGEGEVGGGSLGW